MPSFEPLRLIQIQPRRGRRLLALLCAVVGIGSGMALHMQKAQAAPGPQTFGDRDAKKPPSMHQLFRSSQLPKTYADFSMFHFVPRGSIIVEQPERGRLIFRSRKTGQPNGYAELKGDSVLYYDPAGRPIRLQHLTPEEMDRWNKNALANR
ncbi:hypothetical protein [Oecophyllibacter saccharovorans]|uniref:hypothetical protein n=1 Tax=Oecophyllibacter saccharovorans TaxID=2558360 RepID=UPI001142C8EF|nr:hypothetical protein [Oecophyllibacter saccharovorans]QDH15235.1 hypothetical protein E3E11_04515 [Oecophyllibacter saccharovorans]TPW36251.1 hypothetical protein E3203_00100 [Oecophyllibacter saccharovorans]